MGTITPPFVSVIIPTYNRKESLLRTLDSLARQTYPAERFEVIVVDDGGSDGTEEITRLNYPFDLHYIKQANQGDAYARNRGAQEAKGWILQFLDDDIVLDPRFLAAIVKQHMHRDRQVVVGSLLPLPSATPTAFERAIINAQSGRGCMAGELEFTEILSGVLSIRREHYLNLGMMQPMVSGGSSVWCDVEFSYRAHNRGFSLCRVPDAVAYHDDYTLRDLRVTCQRALRAAAAGAALFNRHPQLRAHIPMFRDKGPIAWRSDPPALILHKLARQVVSSRPLMAAMERAVPLLERHAPDSTALRLLYRWIISGYIYRGYRQGLREMAQRANPP